jgi:hypothetical protein
MLKKNKSLLLAGAVLAAVPAVSSAAITLTVSLDLTTLKYGTAGTASSGWTALPEATSAPANGVYFNTTTDTAYIPAGDGVVYGLDGSISGSNTTGTAIGLASWGFGLSNSKSSVAAPSGGTTNATAIFNGTNTPTYNAAYVGAEWTAGSPKSNGSGGDNILTDGNIGASWATPGSTPAGYIPVGATSTLLVSNLEIDITSGATAASGTAAIGLTNYTSGNLYRANYAFYSNPGGSPANISDTVLSSATDTVSLTGAVLNVGVATPSGSSSSSSSTSSTSAHPIVTLANGSLAGGSYGSQLGATLNMVGTHGSYLPAFTGLIQPPAATGFALAQNFNPVTDTEVYALQLNYSGGVVSPSNTTLIAAIISDINNGTGNGTAASNVSASTITGAYASLFPSYDILLTSTGGFNAGTGGVAALGIDFSQDTDAATPGLVVTEVAAVPEPTTAAVAVVGAAGLLLGRRKKQMATA